MDHGNALVSELRKNQLLFQFIACPGYLIQANGASTQAVESVLISTALTRLPGEKPESLYCIRELGIHDEQAPVGTHPVIAPGVLRNGLYDTLHTPEMHFTDMIATSFQYDNKCSHRLPENCHRAFLYNCRDKIFP